MDVECGAAQGGNRRQHHDSAESSLNHLIFHREDDSKCPVKIGIDRFTPDFERQFIM